MRTRHLIPLLAVCSAIGPIGNFLFVPALPQIAAWFQVDTATAQLTVTAYLVSFAASVLVSGPLADRYGRKPLLLAGLAICTTGTLLSWMAPSMGWFVAARVIHAAGGGVGITVARASVGDLFQHRELARMYAILTMALVLSTGTAPYVGGLITESFGWRAGFPVLVLVTLLTLAACWRWLPETRARLRSEHSFADLWRASHAVLANGTFVGYLVQSALLYSVFLVFVTLAPHVMAEAMHMSAERFGLYYLFLCGGFFLGNLYVSRLAERHSLERQVIAGLCLQFGGSAAALVLVLFGFTHPMAVFLPMMLLSFGQGLMLSNIIAHGVSLSPNYSGVASSLFGFTQLAWSAIAVQLMGLTPTTSWQPALWYCTLCSAVAFAGIVALQRREHSDAPA